jgi:hypothetical protein
MDIPTSIQNITPECRANRTSFGALEEAIHRIRQAYVAYHDAPDNANVTWRISLVRVDAALNERPVARLHHERGSYMIAKAAMETVTCLAEHLERSAGAEGLAIDYDDCAAIAVDLRALLTAARQASNHAALEAERDALRVARHGSGEQWTKIIDPIAAKFEIAAKFKADAVFNNLGAEAVGQLLREMARIIDTEIVARAALQPSDTGGE